MLRKRSNTSRTKIGPKRARSDRGVQLRPTRTGIGSCVARFLSRTRQPDRSNFGNSSKNSRRSPRQDRQDEAPVALMLGKRRGPKRGSSVARFKQDGRRGLAAYRAVVDPKMKQATALSRCEKSSTIRTRSSAAIQAAFLELSARQRIRLDDERVTDAWSRIEKMGHEKSATARDALVLLAQRELGGK